MKYIYYILIILLLFSCTQKKEYEDNSYYKFLTVKTPSASENPTGDYRVDYIFEYDSRSIDLKAESSSNEIFPINGTLTVKLPKRYNIKDSITFFLKVIPGSSQTDYSVVLNDVISKYRANTTSNYEVLPKNIQLPNRTLKGDDDWKLDFTKNMYNPYFNYNVPLESWLYWILLIGGILFLLTVLFFILKRDNMPFGRQTFENGRLTFNNPQMDTIKLENMEEFDLGKQLNLDIDLKLRHKKVDYKKKKLKVARLYFSDPNMRIEISTLDGKEIASSGYQLFNTDDLIITVNVDNEEKKFNITYFNIINRRS